MIDSGVLVNIYNYRHDVPYEHLSVFTDPNNTMWLEFIGVRSNPSNQSVGMNECQRWRLLFTLPIHLQYHAASDGRQQIAKTLFGPSLMYKLSVPTSKTSETCKLFYEESFLGGPGNMLNKSWTSGYNTLHCESNPVTFHMPIGNMEDRLLVSFITYSVVMVATLLMFLTI
jgi:hypothetical protein